MEKENPESGRSMVEMLGVLAIIGVLSIGGIAGYRFALKKRMANHLLNLINQMAHDIGYFFAAHPYEQKNLETFEELYDFSPAQIKTQCGPYDDYKICSAYWPDFALNLSYSDEEVVKMIAQALAKHLLVKGVAYMDVSKKTSITIHFSAEYLNQENSEESGGNMPTPTLPPLVPPPM